MLRARGTEGTLCRLRRNAIDDEGGYSIIIIGEIRQIIGQIALPTNIFVLLGMGTYAFR